MQDLTGMRFGRLVVRHAAGIRQYRSMIWICVCDCGSDHRVRAGNLKSGQVQSCGCVSREKLIKASTKHGLTVGHKLSREYEAWHSMRQRCLDHNNSNYHNYGGRGIIICDEWLDSFEKFLYDVGSKPSSGHSLDRIDNNKGYCKENCRWATRIQQGENRRTSRPVLRGDGVRFPTIKSAARSVMADPATIREAIAIGRVFKGFTWEFSNDRAGG